MTAETFNETVPYIDPGNCSFEFDQSEFVVNMQYDGEEYKGVSAVPAFPLSSSQEFVHIYKNADSSKLKNCIGVIENVNLLENGSKEAVQSAIQMSCLMPTITKILSIKDEYYNFFWTVETDRGYKDFYIGSPRRHVSLVSNGAMLIKDVQNDFYFIPDPSKLDEHSKHCLDPVV